MHSTAAASVLVFTALEKAAADPKEPFVSEVRSSQYLAFGRCKNQHPIARAVYDWISSSLRGAAAVHPTATLSDSSSEIRAPLITEVSKIV
jgi:hypothetical protein